MYEIPIVETVELRVTEPTGINHPEHGYPMLWSNTTAILINGYLYHRRCYEKHCSIPENANIEIIPFLPSSTSHCCTLCSGIMYSVRKRQQHKPQSHKPGPNKFSFLRKYNEFTTAQDNERIQA
jgi:hypothetical protein